MLNATNIPSARVPIIDERTGLIAREWFAFFQNLFYLTGSGGNDTTLTEVQYPPAPDVAETLSSMPVTPDELAPSPLGVAPTLDPAIGLSVETLTSLLAATEALAVAPAPSPIFNAAVDYIDFNSPVSVTLKAGRIWWDDTGTLNIGMGNGVITQQVGEEFFKYGKASAAISDVHVQLVYKTGVVGASGAVTFAPTVAGITDTDLIIGIATEPLLVNAFGRVTTMGTVRGLNTTGSVYGETWADNDDIWYNPVTGGLTKVKPSAPNIKQQIGTVIRAGSGGGGVFYVKIAGSSILGGTDANVQFTALADKQLIQYDAVAGYWKNIGASTITVGNVSGVVAIANGGTGAATAALARTGLGATTLGANVFTITNPSAITFPRFNADNTISALTASAFRTAIGAGTSSTTGTVTTVSVVSANGFAGTVATATTTPAITIRTTVTGLLKGNGTAISAAVANTDYVPLSTVLTKTADYTIANTDTWIINNKAAAALTLTFPLASAWPGRQITVKNLQAFAVNSASSNVVPIDTAIAGTAILLPVVGNWATMVSDGTNWIIMQQAPNNILLLE